MYRVVLSLVLVHFARSHICVGPLCLVPNQTGLPIKIWHGNQYAPPVYQQPIYSQPVYSQPVYSPPVYSPQPQMPVYQPPSPTLSQFDGIAQQVIALDKLKSCRYDVTEGLNKDGYLLQYNLPNNYNLYDVEVKLKHRVLQVRGSQGWLNDVQVLPEFILSRTSSAFWTVEGSKLQILFALNAATPTERKVTCSGVIDEKTLVIEKLQDIDMQSLYRKSDT